jgi:hypothetical protein
MAWVGSCSGSCAGYQKTTPGGRGSGGEALKLGADGNSVKTEGRGVFPGREDWLQHGEGTERRDICLYRHVRMRDPCAPDSLFDKQSPNRVVWWSLGDLGGMVNQMPMSAGHIWQVGAQSVGMVEHKPLSHIKI